MKILIEKYSDDDSYEEALVGVKSAILFHLETFGAEEMQEDESQVLNRDTQDWYKIHHGGTEQHGENQLE
ncbi:MAG: type II toxin-antitoxin system HicB family antitoxin [Pyrinomonadaceae bacterium]